MGKKLTIEIEEKNESAHPPTVRVYVDGEQVGLLSNLKLELDKDAAFPRLLATVLPVGFASSKLRDFPWAQVELDLR